MTNCEVCSSDYQIQSLSLSCILVKHRAPLAIEVLDTRSTNLTCLIERPYSEDVLASMVRAFSFSQTVTNHPKRASAMIDLLKTIIRCDPILQA